MMVDVAFCTLDLECTPDVLSPAQLAAYEKIEKECNDIKGKLQEWKLINKGELIFGGENFTATQYDGYFDLQNLRTQKFPLKATNRSQKPHSASIQMQSPFPDQKSLSSNKRTTSPLPGKRRAAPTSFADFGEDDDDIPLAKRIARNRDKDFYTPPSKISKTSAKSPKVSEKPKSNPSAPSSSTPPPVVKIRPTEGTSLGGLTIGTEDGKKNLDASAKEAANSKLQGKTFPSLVVLAKPSLKPKDAAATTRSKLDSKVKVVLMLTPSKFTEWLIQEGLLKSVQKCTKHRKNVLKLGVYSDASKFPYSGGYVWINECCPNNFISVFFGSLFENAPHPPSCILKLIYHWSCQTNIQNVVQWVKVDNVYIKGVYTWLRAVCTLSVNQKMKLLGGPGKYVEVGVISLGTTSQNGQQRQVKVEVLGVLDHAEKVIRLRAIEPVSDQDRNYKKRFIAILEPLSRWVQKDSILAIDLTIDKTILQGMGFKNLIQAAASDPTAKHTNSGVMDYLRKVVPRMFQNTLSLLSRQMIQQFLDELVWREQWGSYPLQAFNNITAHIAEQTKLEGGDNLTQRLYQVATNPFKDWSVSECKEPSKVAKIDLSTVETYNDKTALTSSTKKNVPTSNKKLPEKKETRIELKPLEKIKTEKDPWVVPSNKSSKALPKQPLPKPVMKEEIKPPPNTKSIEEIYYGKIWAVEEDTEDLKDVQLECPICNDKFASNQDLQHDIMYHINSEKNANPFQCIFCMEKHTTEEQLNKHCQHHHPIKTKNSTALSYHCLICNNRFNSTILLTTHLQKCHVALELPYKCGACQYRTSAHWDIVTHFYDNHSNSNVLQCPLCLDVFWIYSNGEFIKRNVEMYYLHLRQHFVKNQKKECGKCVLSFVNKGALKYHLLNDHQSYVKWGSKVKRLIFENSAKIVKTTARTTYRVTAPYTVDKSYQQPIVLTVPKGKLCIECDYELNEEGHLKQLMKCHKCQYKSCCGRSMTAHASYCQAGVNPESSVQIELENEMHCVCGFSSSDGNSLARHLATCGHKSAYISHQAAQENVVKKSMFEMLGLTRVEGEKGNEKGFTDSKENEEEGERATNEGEEQDADDVGVVSENVEEGNNDNDGETNNDDGGEENGNDATVLADTAEENENFDDIIEEDGGEEADENAAAGDSLPEDDEPANNSNELIQSHNDVEMSS
ncbi:uncharacterized protein LOC129606325 [Condylostylus longicornis]|uniref:uncharacterized protein LOC129606325 n=1 Tax=Condylostylus longicornis TaxID=2530218 RepID=UPI00244DC8E3|nr:uncharacterized protein LOC129606325 [Condylostylus longicornis]